MKKRVFRPPWSHTDWYRKKCWSRLVKICQPTSINPAYLRKPLHLARRHVVCYCSPLLGAPYHTHSVTIWSISYSADVHSSSYTGSLVALLQPWSLNGIKMLFKRNDYIPAYITNNLHRIFCFISVSVIAYVFLPCGSLHSDGWLV